MTRILKLAPAAGVERPELWTVRGALRATLVRLAYLAIRVAMQLEAADARARARTAKRAPPWPDGAATRLRVTVVEAVVYLAIAALFVVGLAGVFIT